MEQATLRPVPLRPSGPVDPAQALAHVAASLPQLDAAAAEALALVEIAGRTRSAAGEETGLSWDQLGDALYRARKALRRSMFPLSASGWCERAERLLSDRIDGELHPPGPARLDVHLRNCERCVEHERRLGQARERLVAAFVEAHPESVGAGPAERTGPAELRVIEAAVVEQPKPEVWTGPARIVPGFGGPVVQRVETDSPEPPFASFAGPGAPVAYVPIEPRVAAAEPESVLEDDAPDEDKARFATGIVWKGLIAASAALAVFAVVLTILAIVGVGHIF